MSHSHNLRKQVPCNYAAVNVLGRSAISKTKPKTQTSSNKVIPRIEKRNSASNSADSSNIFNTTAGLGTSVRADATREPEVRGGGVGTLPSVLSGPISQLENDPVQLGLL